MTVIRVRATRLRPWRAIVVALALSSSVAVPESSALAGGAPCSVLAVSQNFRSDRTIFCATLEGLPAERLVVSVTRNGGRSWSSKTAVGVPIQNTFISALAVSPQFATDKTVFLQTTDALYASGDDGATFTVADPMGGHGSGYLTALPGPVALGTGVRLALASTIAISSLVQPPLHVPVAGSPDSDTRFLPRAGTGKFAGPPLLAAVQPDPTSDRPRGRVVLYECDAVLTCATLRYAFPYEQSFAGAVLAADFAKSGILYVWLSDRTTREITIYQGRNGGTTFTKWTGLQNVLDAMYKRAPAIPAQLWLATNPQNGREFTARITSAGNRGGIPLDQLYRSTDGTRWSRLGYANGYRAKGTLPWAIPWGLPYVDVLTSPESGRMLAIGDTGAYQGVFCSVDNGRHWYRNCAR